MNEVIKHTAIFVLAAGNSSRLGSAKQLLAIGGRNLVQHAVSVALASRIGPVLVVTGARRKAVEETLEEMDVQLVYNPDWEEGMGASIRWGTKTARSLYPDLDGLLFMVCDQPFINPAVLHQLVSRQAESRKPIVASAYAGIRGTPVLFHQTCFDDLEQLNGDKGARPMLATREGDIALVEFDEGKTDIDTVTDYETVLRTLNP
jgi:molybdenum cofactor cytidylyltransferase